MNIELKNITGEYPNFHCVLWTDGAKVAKVLNDSTRNDLVVVVLNTQKFGDLLLFIRDHGPRLEIGTMSTDCDLDSFIRCIMRNQLPNPLRIEAPKVVIKNLEHKSMISYLTKVDYNPVDSTLKAANALASLADQITEAESGGK